MKAMVLRQYHQPMEWVEVETPSIGEDEILLQVKACGLCYTDLKIYRGEIPPPIVTLPHTPGHEVAGVVVEVGDRVQGIRKGDAGVLYIYVTCRNCEPCLTGYENLCPNLKRVGFELPGGFAQYVKVPAYAFCPFDPCRSFEEMSILTDAVATSYHAIVGLAGVRPGQTVLIVGAGGLGIHGVQIAKLCGAKVIVADRKEKALSLAQEHGADFLIGPDRTPSEAIRDITRGKGVDAVLEFVGSKETLAWSLPSLRKGGKLIIVGYAPGQPFPLDTMAMHYNEWDIKGSRLCTKTELLRVIGLVEEGKIQPVVSKTFPMEKANDALMELPNEETAGRIVLTNF
ncbi:MAG: alcohol dehydrogenase catalytic domain-containing protein [Deltaproteobacteria bacterium]|nr:alcohol dehydrogenase catalytic domain-containing protein [Deltaproteobacteria bacterium]